MEGRRGRSRRRRPDGCRAVECSTPRRIVARWLSGLRSTREKREEEEEEEEEDTGGDDEAHIRCSTKCLNEVSPVDSARATNRSESPRSETSFGMGIGPFLLYLAVASKTELDKMVEVRKQMAMRLQNAKEEQQRKELQEKPPKLSNDTKAYQTNRRSKCLEPNEHQFSPEVISNLASSIFEQSSTSVVHNECTGCGVSKPEERTEGTGWESKLEAELDSLSLDNIASNRRMKHQKQAKLKDIESTSSQKLMSEEVTDERRGVCPYELERKLHELLETRQQEQIRELETALRRIEHRLQEKETEVSWWKDAACLLSQRVPESSRTGLEFYIPESCITKMERSVPGSRPGLKRRISMSR